MPQRSAFVGQKVQHSLFAMRFRTYQGVARKSGIGITTSKSSFFLAGAPEPRLLALPFGGHPGQSVGQDHRARRHPWFRWAGGGGGGGRWPVGSSRQVSDRRVGVRLLAGLQSGFPSIRMVMADAGYESGKLACELKRRHGWRLHITKRRRRAFKVVGLTWIVERTFAWLARIVA